MANVYVHSGGLVLTDNRKKKEDIDIIFGNHYNYSEPYTGCSACGSLQAKNNLLPRAFFFCAIIGVHSNLAKVRAIARGNIREFPFNAPKEIMEPWTRIIAWSFGLRTD